MAGLISMSHAKNAKSALKNLFEKLKKQQNLAAAGSSADAENTGTPEAEDGAEEADEGSPKEKTPARKTRATKKTEADDNEDGDEEEKPAKTPKKPAVKKGAATPKSAAKKGVGKATAPKKASAGGPKTPAKGKGKKGKAEDSEPEAEAEVETGDVEMAGVDAAAKAEPEDEEVKDVDEDAGKFPHSLTQGTELPILQSSALDAGPATVPDPGPGTGTVEPSPSQSSAPMATPAAPSGPAVANPANPLIPGAEAAVPFVFRTFVPPPRPPILADPTKPLHEIIIQGWTYYYTPYDISVAEHYGMSLEQYLQWKEYNDYTHIFPQPYSMEDALAQAAAERSGKD